MLQITNVSLCPVQKQCNDYKTKIYSLVYTKSELAALFIHRKGNVYKIRIYVPLNGSLAEISWTRHLHQYLLTLACGKL